MTTVCFADAEAAEAGACRGPSPGARKRARLIESERDREQKAPPLPISLVRADESVQKREYLPAETDG